MELNQTNESFGLTQLENTLREHNIPVGTWTGENGTKTLEDLLSEIESGESRLEITTTGELKRIVRVVAVDIIGVNANGRRYRLEDDRQVFKKDGHIKRRPHLHGAVAEKIKGRESIAQATLRGIQEELGITTRERVEPGEVIVETRHTATYPGLESQYEIYKVRVQIERFNPNGYKEEQEAKTTYFVWKPLEA